MSAEQCVHIVYAIDDVLRALEIRVAIHQGSVEQVALEIQRGIESHGHEITHEGGDYTRADGHPSAITWRTTVTLADRFSVTWQHIVRESDDHYKRIGDRT